METTFENITITIEAETPEEAYTKLCNFLDAGCQTQELEFYTDTYSVVDGYGNVIRSGETSELWPDTDECKSSFSDNLDWPDTDECKSSFSDNLEG